MNIPVKVVIECLWGAFAVVWLVGALVAKRTARAQSIGPHLLQRALGVLALLIGFTTEIPLGPLDQAFVPASHAVGYIGVALTLAGIGFAIWARFFLGGNWSARITVKENHTLIRSGPYAWVRHPIYSGILLAVLGTAIAFREVRGLIGVCLVLAMVSLKAHVEENFMIEEFGGEYREYRQQVKAFIPFVY